MSTVYRSRMRAVLTGGASIAVLTTAFSLATGAVAGPTPCTISGGVATCSMDQSSGVTFINSGTVVEIDLKNLTKPITPGSGVAVVDFEFNAGNFDSPLLTVKTDGTLNGATQSAAGLFVKTSGGTGSGGSGGDAGHNNGGDGGLGHAGGGVVIVSMGTLSTLGDDRNAIDVQTLGGKGGGGGGPFGLGRGGAGGVGGYGGNIDITNSAVLLTAGYNAQGIQATARGGDGGKGAAGAAGVGGVNGLAGNGGLAGSVTITSSGAITTLGDAATGIYAKTLGGTGEDGATGGENGAGGGSGGGITVTNAGATILTSGSMAYGVFADSVGGLGGTGRFVGGAIVTGGSGGTGGGGATVLVSDAGTIKTAGADAFGIFARSLGGTGGIGANAGGVIANSGTGGAGGNAGQVFVDIASSGLVITTGNNAHAVFAQSIGGAGNIGGNVAGLIADAAGGGNGGAGGAVTVTNAGTLSTAGTHAYAIYAFSAGGSAGTGGIAGGGVALGGDGGSGTRAGDLIVSNSGLLSTTGQGAIALLAQSIGGGGGDAGDGVGFVGLGGIGSTASADACIADPAKCNDGGKIVVNHTGAISTANKNATAILAQSIGGGGGNGGSGTGMVAIGGYSGAGGNGGEIDINSLGLINVTGDQAHGIFVQSIGGGGGNGGEASTIGISTAVGVGGRGGAGGNGGLVKIVTGGVMTAEGNTASAIFAQSIGGGGGTGGDASAVGLSLLPVSVGGGGGNGGHGGVVDINNAAHISVVGDLSDGIFAQSIGGGGGSGGAAYSFGVSPVVNIAIAVGGFGGQGGNGETVTVKNTGVVETWGDGARGVFAQSVGGGGGVGGTSVANAISLSPSQAISIAVAVGGNGGDGGVGGSVYLTNDNLVTTLGDGSHGLEVQSVGGGGGIGGDAGAMAVAIAGKGAASLSVAVGGHGGAGNFGGAVTLTNTARIETCGEGSYGILAQSVGGGGGEGGGGTANAEEVNRRAGVVLTNGKKLVNFVGTKLKLATKTVQKADKTKAKSIAISVGVGGYGGAGGEGNFAIVDNSGAIETWGYGAVGIFGQSIGGGGGISGTGAEKTEKVPLSKGLEVGGGFGSNGGSAGNGGTVWITNTGSIVTRNEVAYGLFAQSIGGGGGVGGIGSSEGGIIAADIGVGGDGGSSGNGGHILINQTGNIATLGNMSFGVFGQSVGGGGGVGGAGRGEYTSKVTVAGRGGSGGNGGPIDMFVKGNITTQGGGAFGLFAQSIGGGGGVAGDVEGSPITILGVTVYNKPVSGLIAVAGIGGAGGDGGAVTVNFEGNIVTTGFGADGIEAQSIGGGGGIRGASAEGLTIKGSTGDLGSGGTIDITHKGNISATGVNADGIYAQSMGCHISATTTCIAPPLSPLLALLLPPVGTLDANGSAITISVSGGTVTGGSGEGAGIEMSNGAANLVTVASDSTVTALSGMAILATSSDPRVSDTVNNSGRVFGNVSLTGGKPAAFNNLVGAVFRPGSKVDLDDGDLTNTGTLQPGGPANGAIVALTGNLMENAGSIYDIDVGFGLSATDRIDASGTATVGGTIVTHFTAIMNQPTAIVTSVGAMTSANPVSQFSSVVLHFTLDFSAHALTLTPVANWAPPGMTDNETAVGRYFQAIWDGGGAVPLAGAMGILANIASLPSYADALNHMTPAVYATAIAGEQENAQNFADNMMSCHGLSDAHSAISEEDCHWVELSGGRRKQTGTISADPSDYRDIRAQTGHQVHLNQNWLIGGAIGYDKWHGTTGTLGRTSGEDFSAGLVAKYLDGNWLHAGALSVSYGSLSAVRLLTIPAPTGVFGHTHTLTVGLRGRSAYLFDARAFYFKPYADLDLNYYHMDGFVETGGGALSLHVADKGKFAAILSPTLEAGSVFQLFGTSIARPYLFGGFIMSSGGNWAVSAGFDGAPPSIPNFTISAPTHQVTGRIGGGIELLNAGTVLLKVEYDNRFAGHYSSWNGMAKLGVEF